MGHVINPITQRLGRTRYWSALWASSNSSSTYGNLIINDQFLFKYLKAFFSRASYRFFKLSLILLNIKILHFSQTSLILLTLQFQFFTRLLNLITSMRPIVKEGIEKSDILWYQKKYRHKDKAKTARKPTRRFSKKPSNKPVLSKNIKLPVLSQFRATRLVVYAPKIDLFVHTKLFLARAVKFRTRERLKMKTFYYWRLHLLKVLFLSFWVKQVKLLLNASLRNYAPFHNYQYVFAFNTKSGISADFIAKFISTRLLQKFPLKGLMRTIVSQLKLAYRAGWITGFKISCNGRFARRGRATHWWKLAENVPNSDVTIHVDYSVMLPILTNSICAVKVWLTRTSPTSKLFIL